MKLLNQWTVSALLFTAIGFTTLANAASVSGQGTWETTLQGRDLDGNTTTAEAYYDTALNITWAANANINNGTMDWNAAKMWAASLTIDGVGGWRLPTLGPINGLAFDYNGSFDGSTDLGYNISAPGTAYAGSTVNEMAYLHYNTLGNKGGHDINGSNECSIYCLTNTGPFSNLQSDRYWFGLVYALDTAGAWAFNFTNGQQTTPPKSITYFALAVHTGDVGVAISSVPVPAAVWLFGSGLIGLIGIAKRKKAA